ncbi:carbohydrate ABC transporter permease [Nitratireductor sp. XY-223]|uniref:carbohydrate ABC transporter permease n=1 Tax=Nitratireductor sp. XY-223 TaxID=2561926 RepID=UPI0010AABE08|nr:carbohydrate ABC transporter permease [Nitratireductor sp. XY-223]
MRLSRKTRLALRKAGRNAVLLCLAAIAMIYLIGPVYWMVSTSLMTEKEMFQVPPHWYPHDPSFHAYRAIFGFNPELVAEVNARGLQVQNIMPALWNSIKTSVFVAFATILIAIPAAYSFARLRFRLSLPLLMAYMMLRTVPSIVLVVPVFMVLRTIGLIDTTASLVLVYCTFTVPFSIWLLQSYFKTIPIELEEAAWVDGCGQLTAAIRIMLPLAVPGIVATFILAFMASWSEFLYAVTFTKTLNSQTVTVIASSFIGIEAARFDLVLAAGVLSSLPPFILALIVQRYIVAGFAAGSLKG